MSDRPYTADQLHHAAEAMGRYILGCGTFESGETIVSRVAIQRRDDDNNVVGETEVSFDALFNYLDKLHGIKRREKPPAPPPTKTI